MKSHRGVTQLLKQAGAVFVRRSKHYIFQLPNGRKLTIAGTPSDRYAVVNQMREIKEASGLVEEKRKNPDRVEKQGRLDSQGRVATREWYAADKRPAPPLPSMREQLSSYGIIERAQRQQIDDLTLQVAMKEAVIVSHEKTLNALVDLMEQWQCPCFVCRLRRTFHV